MATERESVELVGDELVGNIARAALFAALMGASGYVSFPNPISPIPVTMQVLVVFLAGIFLGPVWGGGSIALYLAARRPDRRLPLVVPRRRRRRRPRRPRRYQRR